MWPTWTSVRSQASRESQSQEKNNKHWSKQREQNRRFLAQEKLRRIWLLLKIYFYKLSIGKVMDDLIVFSVLHSNLIFIRVLSDLIVTKKWLSLFLATKMKSTGRWFSLECYALKFSKVAYREPVSHLLLSEWHSIPSMSNIDVRGGR